MRASTIVWTLWATLAAMPATAGELVGKGVISTGLQETSTAVTPDGDTMYFMRSDFAEKDDTILVSHRRNGQWSTPAVVSFSGQWHDSEPALSPDGKRLYFVSNRPVRTGDPSLVVEMAGKHFPGTNLWYVERQSSSEWGPPVHVEGALNDGGMIYNPSIAANDDIYFSAHRDDSGKAYQIYVSRHTPTGYAPPQRVDLGDIEHNRMDPAVDPAQRFMLYAGNEGDSLGSADIYIAFRDATGHWGKPERVPGEVNSESLENAPSLGRAYGELYVSSNRQDEVRFPKKTDDMASLQQRLSGPLNGSRNLWRFDIAALLKAHGIDR